MESKTKQDISKLLLYCSLLTLMSLLAFRVFIVEAQAAERFSRYEREYLAGLFRGIEDDSAAAVRVFFDARLKKLPVVVNQNVTNQECQRNYDEFLSPYSMKIATRFARKWRTMLDRAGQRFDVDREVLVAVLLVETGFGNVLGHHPVVSVYSSIVVEEMNQQKCVQNQSDGCLDAYSRARLRDKAAWAENELKALFKIAQQSGYSMFELKGSYAGAFGIPQFLPSSYLKWGYDSDQSGSVNLFLIPDAIFSTANYLKSHGWQKGLHHPANRDVIWEYNHSRIYVDTIMKIAQRLRKNPAETQKGSAVADENSVTLKISGSDTKNPS